MAIATDACWVKLFVLNREYFMLNHAFLSRFLCRTTFMNCNGLQIFGPHNEMISIGISLCVAQRDRQSNPRRVCIVWRVKTCFYNALNNETNINMIRKNMLTLLYYMSKNKTTANKLLVAYAFPEIISFTVFVVHEIPVMINFSWWYLNIATDNNMAMAYKRNLWQHSHVCKFWWWGLLRFIKYTNVANCWTLTNCHLFG